MVAKMWKILLLLNCLFFAINGSENCQGTSCDQIPSFPYDLGPSLNRLREETEERIKIMFNQSSHDSVEEMAEFQQSIDEFDMDRKNNETIDFPELDVHLSIDEPSLKAKMEELSRSIYEKSLRRMKDETDQMMSNLYLNILNMTYEFLAIPQDEISQYGDNETESVQQEIEEKSVNETDEMKISLSPPKPFDCLDLLEAGNSTSGVYKIYPQGQGVEVYCDMVSNGGGWTVFLSRQRQMFQVDFTRNWDSYRMGFGKATGEYWLGNELLHTMTTSKPYSMRVDAVGNGSPSHVWIEYSNFKIDSNDNKFKLNLCDYHPESTMDPISFVYNNENYFSTLDSDNDPTPKGNCATNRHRGKGGGFWYSVCGLIYPTTPYRSILLWHWSTIDSNKRRAFTLQMKFRPRR